MDCLNLSAAAMLENYTAQDISVEHGFRFLKDPLTYLLIGHTLAEQQAIHIGTDCYVVFALTMISHFIGNFYILV